MVSLLFQNGDTKYHVLVLCDVFYQLDYRLHLVGIDSMSTRLLLVRIDSIDWD